ncbi:hypothetical protein KZ843_09705 [Pseudomonas aeruginosa]|nr:hypothetical protein [Pseudomonas aeruginosa]MBW6123159.1 hypothetical protein [Pseudomonas aeruginosa]
MKGKNVFGFTLIILAVVLFFVGTKNVSTIQGVALLGPIEILPLALCIAVPTVLFLIGGILAFKGQLTLTTKKQS